MIAFSRFITSSGNTLVAVIFPLFFLIDSFPCLVFFKTSKYCKIESLRACGLLCFISVVKAFILGLLFAGRFEEVSKARVLSVCVQL